MGPLGGAVASADLRRYLLRGNVFALAVVSLLNDAASEMIYPLLPLFLVGSLGASTTALGAIEGVAESTSSLLKLASGWLSDRWRRRKPFLLGGYAIAAVMRPLMAFATVAGHVLAIRFTDRIGKGIRSAPRDALLAESVPPEYRGRAFGFHRAADHAGAVIGPLVAAGLLLLLDNDLRMVFALAIVPGAITILLVVLFVREPPRAPPPLVPAPRLQFRTLDPVLLRFLAGLALFTLGNASSAFLLLRAEQIGVPVALIPALWATLNVSRMILNVVGGSLSDRFGPRNAIVAGWFVFALVYGAFGWASEPWHAWALFIAFGAFFGLTESPEKVLVAQVVPAHQRGAAFGAYHFIIGISALPSSLLFGWLWHRYDARVAFAVSALLAGAAAILIAVSLPRAITDAERPA